MVMKGITSVISRGVTMFPEKTFDQEQEDQILHTPFMIRHFSGTMIEIPSLLTTWGEKSYEVWVHVYIFSPCYFILQYCAYTYQMLNGRLLNE